MPNVDTHPYAFAWYILVSRFSVDVRGSWKSVEKKISEPKVMLEDISVAKLVTGEELAEELTNDDNPRPATAVIELNQESKPFKIHRLPKLQIISDISSKLASINQKFLEN